MQKHSGEDENTIWMNTLTQTIRQNLDDPYLTNAKLAELIGQSERQLYRRVELFTGMSPNHYIREIRLQRAAELLKSGKFMTVKEVAMRVGFIKVSYFSKIFEEKNGQRPSQILKDLDL